MTTETPDTGTNDPGEPPAEPSAEDQLAAAKAEADKWKALSRKHEGEKKSTHAELEKIRKDSLSEQEQAIQAAVDKASADTAAKFGSKIVHAEVKAALAGRSVDIEAVLEGLDSSKFLIDGDVDTDAIQTWASRLAPEVSKPAPDLGQGPRGEVPGLGSSQLERDLKQKLGMT